MHPDARLPWTVILWLGFAGLVVGALGPPLHDVVISRGVATWSDYATPVGLFWAASLALTAAGAALTLTLFRTVWVRVPVAAGLGLLADIACSHASFPQAWVPSETSALCACGAAALALMHSAYAPFVRDGATMIALLWSLLAGIAAGTIGVQIVPRATTGGALVLGIVISITQCAALAGALTFPSKEPPPLRFHIRQVSLRTAITIVALLAAGLTGWIRLRYRYEINGRQAADASMLDGSSPWIWSRSGWSLPRPGFVPP